MIPSNMNYRDWETVYLKKDIAFRQWKEIQEKFTHHDLKHGIIKVNKAVIKSTPNDVHVVVASKGGKTWNFYDENGWIYLQVSDNAHGHKKDASFGKHGEHAHFYTEIKNGIPQHGTAVEIPSFVRKALGDDL